MSRYALVTAGVVTNIIIADQKFVDGLPEGITGVLLPDPVEIGWLWDGAAFTPALPVQPTVVTVDAADVADVVAAIRAAVGLDPQRVAELETKFNPPKRED